MSVTELAGEVIRGLGAASGQGEYGLKYPDGTIAMQKPGFRALGIADIETWHNGTINVQLSHQLHIVEPDYTLENYEWAPGETETFGLLACAIECKGLRYSGYIYRPWPSQHAVHKPDTVELLAEEIAGLSYGDKITISVKSAAVELRFKSPLTTEPSVN